jgi:PAS domain S-box-containing protein
MWIKTKVGRLVAIALLLAWWLACWLATGAHFDGEAQEAYSTESARAERFVADAVPGYNRIFRTHSGVPRVLARDPDIRRTLARFGPKPPPPPANEDERRRRWSADPDLAQTSSFLEVSARELGFDALVLLDANGDCVAASNAGSARSIVGASYGDRADFQSARAGHSGYLASAGKRMGGTGVSFYAPVMDHGRFIGVVGGGNALAPFVNLIDQADAFLSDRNGVVLLARDSSLMLHALPGAPVSRLDTAARQALYQRTELTTLDFSPWGNKRFPELLRVPGRVAPAILRSGSVADGGLTVSVLWPMPQLLVLTQQRLLYASALGIIGTLLLLLAAVYVTRRREQRVMALALAEREQTATDSRNFLDQIVNAIADPIFVKDREHRWVLVNQSFCEFLGQPRAYFIGKSDLDVLPEREARIFWDTDERVLTAGIESINEEKITDSQGRTHIVVTKKARYTDTAGQRFIVGIISDISERKQVERLLRAKEREFRTLAENNPDVVIRYDRECRRTYANAAVATMAGRKAGELVGWLTLDHTPLVDPEGYMVELRQVMDSGTPSHFEVEVRRASGEVGWYASSIVAEFDEDGQVVGALTVARDITEIKQAQARVSRFVANVPGFVYSFRMGPDDHVSFPFVSPGIEDIFGMRPEDLIDDAASIFQTFQPDDLERGRVELRASARELTPFQFEYRVRRPGMPERWIEALALPEREADGGTLWHGLQIDITERKQMQALLERREHEFRSLAENLPVAVIRYDSECRRRYLNPSAQRMLRGSSTELLGLVPGGGGIPASPTMIAHYRGKMEEVLATDTARELGFVLDELPSDSQGHYEVRFVPEHDPDGKTNGVLAIWYDITERKRLESEVKQREAEFRALAENLPNAVFRYDRDCRCVYVNPAAERVTAMSEEQLLGHTPANCVTLTPVDAARTMANIREVVATGERRSFFVGYLNSDGSSSEYQGLLVPEFDASGQVDTVLAMAHDVTALRQAEHRAASFFANMPGFAYALRLLPDGRMSLPFASSGIEDIYGLRPEDVRDDASPLHALEHSDDLPRIEAASTLAAQTLQPFQVEFRVQRPGHPQRWIESRSMPQHQADGTILWHGVMLDITERKRAQIALQENFYLLTELNVHLERQAQELTASQEQLQLTEAWYRSILRSAPDGMLVIDRHGVIVQANGQLETLFGYEEKELIGSHVEMLVPAAIQEMHVNKRIDFVTSGRVDRPMASALNLHGCRKNGSEFPIDISLSQLPDIAGRVGAICAAIRDITERKRLENALHAREQEFRALVENSPDAIFRYDLDCRRVYLNPAVERITGAQAATLLGKTPVEGLIHDISLGEKQLTCVQWVLASGTPTETELAWVQADGTPRHFHMHFVPEHGPDGQVTSALAVGRDISAIKQAEAHLRQSRDVLRALAAHQETEHEKTRRELAFQIHEDLAQNLTALRMNISLFEMSGDAASRAPLLKAMSAIAERSIVRIRDIVSMLRPTVLDLGLVPALQWLTDDFKGVGFKFDLALQEHILLHDETAIFLFRVAQEALINVALHAAATHIQLSLDCVAGVCRLVVRDNGCGFDPAAPRREGSFGLIGLFEQARHHGGNLFIDSTCGQGTALEVQVPAFRTTTVGISLPARDASL